MKLCDALLQSARAADLSPVSIAAEIGVSQTTVQRWLDGQREPGWRHFLALVRVVPGFGEIMSVEIIAA